MNFYLRLLIVGWLAVLGRDIAFSQALSIRTPESAAPGGKTYIDILQSSSPGQAPLIIQWDLAFPARSLTLDPDYPVISEPAKQAGKSVYCRGVWKKAPTDYLLRCIVAGGQKTIPDGTIASLRFTVAPIRQSTKIPFVIENVDVLFEGMRRQKGKNFAATLIVRP